MNIHQVLDIDELRGRLLQHSRRAYGLLPSLNKPQILDIGCGRGLQTIELANLGGGKVVGIDVDQAAIATLQQRIDNAGLSHRVKALHVSLFDNEFADGQFDLLWEEGVFHLLDTSRCLSECVRLLRPLGHLVMHETIEWLKQSKGTLWELGLELMNQHVLPRDFWWTEYGAPLEERIRAYRAARGDLADYPELAMYESQVDSIKRDPDRTACGIYVARRVA